MVAQSQRWGTGRIESCHPLGGDVGAAGGFKMNQRNMSNNNSSSGVIGFFGMLAIVFIVLKLCNVVDWSWWWVTCPLWGPVALWLVIMGLLFLWATIRVCFFSTPEQKEQMERIKAAGKKNAGKSKWQIRMEDMQKAQELRENK